MPLQALQVFEKKIEKRIRLFEQKLEQNIEKGLRKFEQRKNVILLDDDVRFIRSWIEKPLAMGAVTPSSRILARTMASFVEPEIPGPVIELGPGTGPVTEALVSRGIDPSRLVLVEFNPAFCQLLRERYPTATVVQGDAYRLKRLLETELPHPAAAVVSGLPLVTKPMRTRLRLLREALDLLRPGAPYVQFTYSVVPPIPRFTGVQVEASERIWLNLPPARVWTYRHSPH
jgi:phosphatidylethanolamine/phosphatidyl-N-methylethanolamine N-methyltransferase